MRKQKKLKCALRSMLPTKYDMITGAQRELLTGGLYFVNL